MKMQTVRIALACAMFSAMFAAHDACAVLGGAPTYASSAASSQATQRAAVASGAMASYTVQQTTLDTGTVVREYIANGVVFGIAWLGPQMPDLRTLLGTYFPQYVSDIETQRRYQGGHGPVRVHSSTLVARSGGHMGDFSGQAFLPQSLPTGVTESDIR